MKFIEVGIGLVIILLILGVLSSISRQKFEGKTAEEWYESYAQESIINIQIYNRISDLESELDDYKNALDEANSIIRKAKYYAWESYEEMGNALDNLETINP